MLTFFSSGYWEGWQIGYSTNNQPDE